MRIQSTASRFCQVPSCVSVFTLASSLESVFVCVCFFFSQALVRFFLASAAVTHRVVVSCCSLWAVRDEDVSPLRVVR